MEYYPFMKKFTKTVLRTFYEPVDIILMDILLEHLILKEPEFCSLMKVSLKEFNKKMVRLREDKLIKQESKIETDIDGKQILNQVFYLDFKEIRDIVRYKIHKMTRNLDEKIKKYHENESYFCEKCEKEFSILEVQSLMKNFTFFCDECDTELVENKKLDNPHDLYYVMMKDVGMVVEMLREADKLDLQNVDYFQAIEFKNKIKEDKMKEGANKVVEIKKQEESEIVDDLGILETDNYSSPMIENSKTPSEDNLEVTCFEEIQNKAPDEKNKMPIIDELIKIGDKYKKLSEITDEDKENMDSEEYEKYYEIYMKYN
ncbi:Transcription initiation factor IIE subunit alpha [Dictyocoela muelleri]|nr:Transcription initiation factor IIE subunit alpha [Dictyocoela muelleri]